MNGRQISLAQQSRLQVQAIGRMSERTTDFSCHSKIGFRSRKSDEWADMRWIFLCHNKVSFRFKRSGDGFSLITMRWASSGDGFSFITTRSALGPRDRADGHQVFFGCCSIPITEGELKTCFDLGKFHWLCNSVLPNQPFCCYDLLTRVKQDKPLLCSQKIQNISAYFPKHLRPSSKTSPPVFRNISAHLS